MYKKHNPVEKIYMKIEIKFKLKNVFQNFLPDLSVSNGNFFVCFEM